MTGIFVANIDSASEQRAFEESATRPLDRHRVLASFSSTEQAELENIEREAHGFFAWRAADDEAAHNSWSHLERDDMVLINYQGKYRHFARVLGRYQNRSAAQAIWGNGTDADEYLYFLSEPVPIDLPAAALDDYMLEPGEGLNRVGEPICDRIETDYGNLERFARLRLLNHSQQLKNHSVVRTTIGNELAAAQAALVADIENRRGDAQLREVLLKAYGGRCAITANSAECNLETAYIIPDRGELTHSPSNAILLRADLHNLFDLGRLAIDTRTLTVRISQEILGSSYRILQGRPVRLPDNPELRPDLFALDMHQRLCRI
jgi:hypothetical protein